ncbi:MAG TPA: tellurite resistance/C4-dicarboxylate transporter family protein [Bellilinea sp.]|nr:tellurite resistance/C4-dicarboxylate transporter family protein [Bellilinea sp.]
MRQPSSLVTTLRSSVETLFPGYFAMVMATGIVSIACHLHEMERFAWWLLFINIGSYIILWVLTLARIAFFTQRFTTDLADHAKGPGFFTMIASTCVLGSQLDLIAGNTTVALYLLAFGLVLWTLITYSFYTAVTTKSLKPTIQRGLNGTWLIPIVGTQSIVVLGTILSDQFGRFTEIVLFFTLSMYLFGVMLYILVMSLIFYRWTFVRMQPNELTPPYWINMGALAITTLASATLILNAARWEFLTEIMPFLKGMTLFTWAAGTWWIPLLFILGAWRHMVMRYPLRYDPQYWSMVFPLGMYTTCTFQMAKAFGIDFIYSIPQYFIYLAIAGWLAAFLGLLVHLFNGLRVSTAKRGN